MSRGWKHLSIATHWPMLVAIAILVLMGCLSIWAISPQDARKQLLFVGGGGLLLAAVQAVSYRVVGRWAWGLYVVSLLLLLYTIIPGMPLVRAKDNVRAWLTLGPVNFQPAELAKIGFCMVLARYLRFRSNYRTVRGLVPPFLLALAPVLLILRQPDLGTALVFIPALFAMLFAAGARLKHLLAVLGMGLAMAPAIWLAGTDVPLFRHLPEMIKGYQRERVYAMFSRDPRTLQRTGYQQEQALTAFGSGGVSGRGALNIPVGRSVPEGHNDMIFALIGEQFGFVGAATLLAAYLVLFAAGIEIAAGTREPFGRLLAVGIIALLAGQAFLNLLVATRLMPVTGITLPFVSYGGSSVLASFLAAGLLLNIAQTRPLVIARESFEFDRG